MRKLALVTLAALVVAGSAVASTAQVPRLRLTNGSPMTVSGIGFRNHEHVTVVYRADETSTRQVTATTAGTFTARFVGIRFEACKLHRLTAVGSMGSKAVFKMPPAACAPPTDGP